MVKGWDIFNRLRNNKMKNENSLWQCLRCKKDIIGTGIISRRDNKTEICIGCGKGEEIFDKAISQIKFDTNHNETLVRLKNEEKKWLGNNNNQLKIEVEKSIKHLESLKK